MAGAGGKGSPSEWSAGGVVVRGRECVVIVPTRRAANGDKVLALPKGHVDPGETPVQAAAREVREEAGVDTELVGELGAVRYWYMRSGKRIAKQVDFFLFTYAGGDVADHDHEVERACWMPLREAAERLTYDGERDMAARALSQITSDE
ncbi:MAG TPA: NUDIX hydrolase [Baekduia sp.]|uniref:NUDIX hydrolase n=1 Tax=Baekduia sp. TaxID=2600305 RepID=UPI002D76F204|nr:NUDIX hydrolase [Baekduia sp.]HET6505491.1 NUDIX hydrolase [Baekduia sp.]